MNIESMTEEEKRRILEVVDVTITHHVTNVDEIIDLIMLWGVWTSEGITLDRLKKFVYTHRVNKLFDRMEQVSELVWRAKDTPPEDNNPNDQNPKDTTP